MSSKVFRISGAALLLWLAIFSAREACSQDLEVGITGGGCYYLGDLNPGMHFMNTQIAYGAVVRLNLDTRWSFRLSGMRGVMKGNAAQTVYLPERALTFTSELTDIAGVVEFNFLPYFTGSFRSVFSPYIFGGISVFFFEPMANGVSLRALGTEGQNDGYLGRSPYATTSVSVPFGLGARFSIASRLSLQVYWEMHKTFTDYIDDVSTTYYLVGKDIKKDDLEGIMSDPTQNHTPGMQRGNPGTKDWYAFFGIGLTYKFNLVSSKKCRELDH